MSVLVSSSMKITDGFQMKKLSKHAGSPLTRAESQPDGCRNKLTEVAFAMPLTKAYDEGTGFRDLGT